MVAIPSHRRAELLVERTLAYLETTDVPICMVTVFVSDAEDLNAYTEACKRYVEKGLSIQCTGTKGATAKFNAIHGAYLPGERVFVIEDDIDLIEGLEPKANKKRPLTALDAVITRGFSEIPLGGIWGVAPHDNAFYFSGKAKHGLFLVVAHAFGFVATKEPVLEVECGSKTDYERTCKYFVRYGEVVRLDWVGVRTKSYTTPGGMQAGLSRTDRAAVELLACAQLAERYPLLLEVNKSKESMFTELRFKKCKLAPASLRAWQAEHEEKLRARARGER